LERKVDGEDSRRLWFAKEIDLLQAINLEWIKRKERHQQDVLKQYPFNNDNM
tara:strand:- start:3904 stop:4059 length:156 start_codon:yes stop_codon:yes gene_type:complete